MALILRGKTYYLRRRVPGRYSDVEHRSEILHSLHTDSLSVAETKSKAVWDQLVEAWEARIAGNTDDAEARYGAARNLAKLRGFQYLLGAKVAQLPIKDLLARIDAIPMTPREPNLREADALLGLADPPAIPVTQSLKLFWGVLGADLG